MHCAHSSQFLQYYQSLNVRLVQVVAPSRSLARRSIFIPATGCEAGHFRRPSNHVARRRHRDGDVERAGGLAVRPGGTRPKDANLASFGGCPSPVIAAKVSGSRALPVAARARRIAGVTSRPPRARSAVKATGTDPRRAVLNRFCMGFGREPFLRRVVLRAAQVRGERPSTHRSGNFSYKRIRG
jgi:hypothetical protein